MKKTILILLIIFLLISAFVAYDWFKEPEPPSSPVVAPTLSLE